MQSGGSAENVLVTGATGFIGGNLVRELLQRGYSVTCLVRNQSNTEPLRRQNVRLVLGDLNDPESIRKAVKAVKTVYHVAGAIKALSKEEYFRTNHVGTRNLLEAVAEVNPAPKRFIYISSLAAAGASRADQKLSETAEPNPISWYGKSKLEGEKEALRYSRIFPVTILRPSAVYGPGDKETLILFRMIKHGCLVTPGRLVRRFSLIHVRDLIEGIIRGGESNTPSGEIYFLSRPEIYTWEEVGREVAKQLGKPFRPISFPEWLAKVAGFAGDWYARFAGRPITLNSQKIKELLEPSWLCNSSKAEMLLGFRPAIDLETGIADTLHWYQEEGWL